MTLETIVAFTLAMVAFGLTPGPAVFATITRSLANGFWAAFALNLGVIVGDVIFLVLAIYGLSAIAEIMGEVFLVVKIAGGGYLIWLGIQMWRAEPAPLDAPVAASRGFWRDVLAGFVVTFANPKVILFYGALLPSFMDLSVLTIRDTVIASMIIVGVLLVVNNSYGLLADRMRRLFRSRRAVRNLNRGAGTVMVGVGIAVATR